MWGGIQLWFCLWSLVEDLVGSTVLIFQMGHVGSSVIVIFCGGAYGELSLGFYGRVCVEFSFFSVCGGVWCFMEGLVGNSFSCGEYSLEFYGRACGEFSLGFVGGGLWGVQIDVLWGGGGTRLQWSSGKLCECLNLYPVLLCLHHDCIVITGIDAPSLTGKSGTHPCSPVRKWLPFLRQNTDFSAQNNPFFVIKHWLFSLKWTPFFGGKTLTFQPKWTPLFMVKHWTSKLTLFLQILRGEYQDTLFF